MRQSGETLAGRIEYVNMSPFGALEVGAGAVSSGELLSYRRRDGNGSRTRNPTPHRTLGYRNQTRPRADALEGVYSAP